MTTPTPAQQLEPCPFCGGKPIIQLKGNVKSHRKLTVKCSDCRIQRTDATLRHGEEWLFNIAIAAWNRRIPNTRALAALEALEGWQVRVICVAVKDWDDAHRVEMQRMNQTFRVGPDYWDTREEAEAYAEQLRVALGNPADAVEVSRG